MKGFQREKIWDPVTRLWHWVFAFSVSGAWWLGEFMAFDTVEWHFYAGYFVLGLVLFRWVWGFTGPAPIRFRTFIYTPGQTWQSLKQLGGGLIDPLPRLICAYLLATLNFLAAKMSHSATCV